MGKPAPPSPQKTLVVPNLLKKKTGEGGCCDASVEKAQRLIESNNIDFLPAARDLLDMLAAYAARYRTQQAKGEKEVFKLLYPAMQLNAQGRMFHYPLISDMADVLVNFLENIEELNADALDIVDAHHTAITLIVRRKIAGNGGSAEKAVYDDLVRACRRYHKKYGLDDE
ncbi:MAG: hypothetical protein EA357_10910 [Micavibrio sp.]|nr:MAG: hypothetical protein EA357_10910 [Micavibrio sp.]